MTITIIALLSGSAGVSFGFILGAVMASGKRADVAEKPSPRKRTKRRQPFKPTIVAISPTESRIVKTAP